MLAPARRFLRSDRGATAIEYGLIVALVGVAAIAAIDSLGGAIAGVFTAVTSQLAAAGTS